MYYNTCTCNNNIQQYLHLYSLNNILHTHTHYAHTHYTHTHIIHTHIIHTHYTHTLYTHTLCTHKLLYCKLYRNTTHISHNISSFNETKTFFEAFYQTTGFFHFSRLNQSDQSCPQRTGSNNKTNQIIKKGKK